MLVRTIAALALALSLATIQDSRSQQPPPTNGKLTEPQKKEAAPPEKQPNADQRGTEQSPLTVNILKTPKSEEEAKQEAKDHDEKTSLDNKTLILNALLVLVAALQFAALIVQAYWLRRTVKVSEKAANSAEKSSDAVVASLRAHVYQDEAAIHYLDKPVSQVHVVIKNGGQTPAYGVTDWMGVKLTKFPLAVDLPPPEPGSIRQSISDIGPGVQVNKVQEIRLSDETKSALVAGTMAIYVYGEIRYRDAFKNDRFTRYRLMYGGDVAARPEGAMISCEEAMRQIRAMPACPHGPGVRSTA